MRTCAGPGRRRTRGFTLVELVVVIGVIIFLVGLTLSVGAAVVERAQHRQTENVLRLLDLAVHEWQTTSDRTLRWWDAHHDAGNEVARARADLHSDTAEVLIITEMLRAMERVPSARRIVEQIDPQLVVRYEAGSYPPWIKTPIERRQMDQMAGGMTVLDAWGWPIYATHPGGDWRPGMPALRDEDGTFRTYNEMDYGVARNRTVCFVAAGPDGRFGSLAAPPGSDEHEDALDNLFSYPVR